MKIFNLSNKYYEIIKFILIYILKDIFIRLNIN